MNQNKTYTLKRKCFEYRTGKYSDHVGLGNQHNAVTIQGKLAFTGTWRGKEQILQSLWRKHSLADFLFQPSDINFALLAFITVME